MSGTSDPSDTEEASIDPAEAWLSVERLLAEDERRMALLEACDEHELLAGLAASGIDPARVPTADEMIAYVEARAALRDTSAREPREPRRRPLRATLAYAMGAMAVVALLIAMAFLVAPERCAAIAAAIESSLARMENGVARVLHRGDFRRCESLRRQGIEACRVGQWDACERDLDEAKGLDPAGDLDGRVQAARQQMSDRRMQGAGPKDRAEGQ